MILADFAQPRFNGIMAFHLVKQQGLRIPLVIIADTPDEAEAVVSIKAGAEDYFSRHNQYRLVGKKCYEVFRNFDIKCEDCPNLATIQIGQTVQEIIPRKNKGGETTGWLEIYNFPFTKPDSG